MKSGVEVHVSQACLSSNIFHTMPAKGRIRTWLEHRTSKPAGHLPWPHSCGTCQGNKILRIRSPWHPTGRHPGHTHTVIVGPSTRSATTSNSSMASASRSAEISSNHPPSRQSFTNHERDNLLEIRAKRHGTRSFRRPSGSHLSS
jgi:hypothetical protein